jgi:hypothetical protein
LIDVVVVVVVVAVVVAVDVAVVVAVDIPVVLAVQIAVVVTVVVVVVEVNYKERRIVLVATAGNIAPVGEVPGHTRRCIQEGTRCTHTGHMRTQNRAEGIR